MDFITKVRYPDFISGYNRIKKIIPGVEVKPYNYIKIDKECFKHHSLREFVGQVELIEKINNNINL